MRSEIIERLERLTGISNELDIEVEIALFVPNRTYAAIRPNAAGTKVVYTKRDGSESTHWAYDWTMDVPSAIAQLRALEVSDAE